MYLDNVPNIQSSWVTWARPEESWRLRGDGNGRPVSSLSWVGLFLLRFPKETSICGIGGIECSEDAIQFLLLGASTLQGCTAVMLQGHGIVKEMCELAEKKKNEEKKCRNLDGCNWCEYFDYKMVNC